ncbi:MAG: glycosyltransferase family 4 protein [Verrucomicrobia bacterium]|nr:glycosyltransferase family 4 protein [Verrucomicrobiota bacterium]
MKVCFLSREYPWRQPCGGVGIYTHNMARALADQNCDVSVMTQSPDDNPQSETTDSIRVIGLPFRPFPLLPRRLATFSVVERSAWSHLMSDAVRTIAPADAPDVVEAPEMAGEALTLLRRHERPPVVVRIHSGSSYNLKIRGALRWYHRPLFEAERQCLQLADVVSAVSTFARDQQGEHFALDLSRSHVTPNPVDTGWFRPGGPRSGDESEILFVGRLDAVKGFDTMPAIISNVLTMEPATRFTLAGAEQKAVSSNQPEPSRSFLLSRLSPEHGRQVTFAQVSPREMPALYARASVVLIPSRSEACPYSGLEAAACAIPIVGTRGTGVECVVRDGETGYLVDPTDAKATATRLVELLKNPGRAESFGRAARTHVEQHHSFSVAATRARELYAEIASKGPA